MVVAVIILELLYTSWLVNVDERLSAG